MHPGFLTLPILSPPHFCVMVYPVLSSGHRIGTLGSIMLLTYVGFRVMVWGTTSQRGLWLWRSLWALVARIGANGFQGVTVVLWQ